jgi:hypothetical protein
MKCSVYSPKDLYITYQCTIAKCLIMTKKFYKSWSIEVKSFKTYIFFDVESGTLASLLLNFFPSSLPLRQNKLE